MPAALGYLQRERGLWLLCSAPLALTLALLALATWAFFGIALEPLWAELRAVLEVAAPAVWYAWLWVGPLWLLSAAAQIVLLLACFALWILLFLAVGGIAASPFLDVLSRRIELLETGALVEVDAGWRGALFAVAQEARRTALVVGAALLLAGVGLVPGGQLPAALAGGLFGAFFLPLEYTGCLLDRRGVSFGRRRSWLWAHRFAMLGFASAALVTFLVPLLNFVCLPLLVTAGTRLALELGPPEGELGAPPGRTQA